MDLPALSVGDLAALTSCRVLCVGDVMLDHYVYGHVERISPEAPIPILRIARETRMLGGAGNVLRNLVALGAQPRFISVLGRDAAAREISRLIGETGEIELHILVEPGRVTTVKTRYIAGSQQMLRADSESITPLSLPVRTELLRLVEQQVADCDIVILSDYAKGVLDDGVAAEAIAAARRAGKAVVVDPKSADYSRYAGASIIKPNRRELAVAAGMAAVSQDEIVGAARRLIGAHGFAAMLVSLSEDGMLLVEAEGGTQHLPAVAREVFDVSGAGDTVVATLATALAAGFAAPEAARLANLAAGIVVAKVGTAVVTRAELAEAVVARSDAPTEKMRPTARALEEIQRWRQRGLKIGFTNGCFDLLHPGHVSLLAQARAACDRLVVGLNSDASVARLKGPSRPVQSEAARAAVLSSLATVDLVVVFEEDTPLRLIETIRPDVLVKGADYSFSDVIGGDLVQSWGGRVQLAELSPGYSTTSTIERLVRA